MCPGAQQLEATSKAFLGTKQRAGLGVKQQTQTGTHMGAWHVQAKDYTLSQPLAKTTKPKLQALEHQT